MLKPATVEHETPLSEFVQHARGRGMDFGTMRHLLLASGWKEKQIGDAFAQEVLEIPVPLATRKGGAREAFFHLSAFTCLYVSTVSMILMLFGMIDILLPDRMDSYYSGRWAESVVRSSFSTLAVFFPLYVLFRWLIGKETRAGVIIAGGEVERWLTYLTLFVIVMTVLIDAATLLYSLLEGEMTGPLFLKATLLIVVMGIAFAYLWKGTYTWTPSTMEPTAAGEAPSSQS